MCWRIPLVAIVLFCILSIYECLDDLTSSEEIVHPSLNNHSDKGLFRTRNNALVLVPSQLHFELRPLHDTVWPGSRLSAVKNEPDNCCPPVMNGMCADGLAGTPDCGSQNCNFFGCSCGHCRQGWYATIYKDAYFEGEAIGVVGGFSCRNLNTKFCYKEYLPFSPVIYDKCRDLAEWISSINTHATCVNVYEEADCKGHSLKIGPGQGCHENLDECSVRPNVTWNDRITSIGPCQGYNQPLNFFSYGNKTNN